jgi:hypothetical protein
MNFIGSICRLAITDARHPLSYPVRQFIDLAANQHLTKVRLSLLLDTVINWLPLSSRLFRNVMSARRRFEVFEHSLKLYKVQQTCCYSVEMHFLATFQ